MLYFFDSFIFDFNLAYVSQSFLYKQHEAVWTCQVGSDVALTLKTKVCVSCHGVRLDR